MSCISVNIENTQELIWTTNIRNNEVPVLNRYKYAIKRMLDDDKIELRCCKISCKSRIITDRKMLIKIFYSHDHSVDISEKKLNDFKNIIKQIVNDDPYISSNNIYDKAVRIVSCGSDVNNNNTLILAFSSVKSSIYRYKHQYYAVGGLTMEHILSNSRYNTTLSGRNFFLCKTGVNEGEIYVFGNVEFIRRFFMSNNQGLLVDGTFKSCPEGSYQIYTICGHFLSQTFPLIFGFLPNKNEQTYDTFFNFIKNSMSENNVNFNPPIIQADFEKAAIDALKKNFPVSDVKGCFFHFSQSLWRKIQIMGLVDHYSIVDENNFQKSVRYTVALALIPYDKINEGWEVTLSMISSEDDIVADFFQYVYRTLVSERSIFSRSL
uniref:MULE domain-containing protein n=1 Tax=Strongyloides papillosus TaxID=174720 RepID=A0A0N5C3Z4_STREA